MHPAVTVRKAFPGGQEPSTACPVSLVMGQMYQKFNMMSLWHQLTAQIKAKLAGDLTPSRASPMADLVLTGKPDAQKPGNSHTLRTWSGSVIQVAAPVSLAILPVVPAPQGKLQAEGRVWD